MTLKPLCHAQHGCCRAVMQPLVLLAPLRLQQKLDVLGRAAGLLLAQTSCSLIGWAHDALHSATGSTGTQPWVRPRSKPSGMRLVCRGCQGKTTLLYPQGRSPCLQGEDQWSSQPREEGKWGVTPDAW